MALWIFRYQQRDGRATQKLFFILKELFHQDCKQTELYLSQFFPLSGYFNDNFTSEEYLLRHIKSPNTGENIDLSNLLVNFTYSKIRHAI